MFFWKFWNSLSSIHVLSPWLYWFAGLHTVTSKSPMPPIQVPCTDAKILPRSDGPNLENGLVIKAEVNLRPLESAQSLSLSNPERSIEFGEPTNKAKATTFGSSLVTASQPMTPYLRAGAQTLAVETSTCFL